MIYVTGGTVHTLGPGSIMLETQQQSDTTYRLYDYGRPRELHLKEGLAVIKESSGSGKVVRPAPSNVNGGANRRAPLISAPYFTVDMFELKAPDSFQPVMLAGVRGTRFWPLSRQRRAKQLLALDGKQTMLQQTVARLLPLASATRFWIIPTQHLRREVLRQVPRVNPKQILAEPAAR